MCFREQSRRLRNIKLQLHGSQNWFCAGSDTLIRAGCCGKSYKNQGCVWHSPGKTRAQCEAHTERLGSRRVGFQMVDQGVHEGGSAKALRFWDAAGMGGEAATSPGFMVTDTRFVGLTLAGDRNGRTGVPPASRRGQGKAYAVPRLGTRQHKHGPRCVLVKSNPSQTSMSLVGKY